MKEPFGIGITLVMLLTAVVTVVAYYTTLVGAAFCIFNYFLLYSKGLSARDYLDWAMFCLFTNYLIGSRLSFEEKQNQQNEHLDREEEKMEFRAQWKAITSGGTRWNLESKKPPVSGKDKRF